MRDGLWCMSSIADPTPLSSIKIFKDALEWVGKGNFSQEDIDDAKLVIIGSIDQQYTPALKGLREMLYFDSPEILEV